MIACALLAHTNGVTQPLDVSVSGAFKSKLRDLDDPMSTAGAVNVYDQFDFLKLLTAAYGKSFTHLNIASGFRKYGIYPANVSYVFAQPRPFSSSQCDKIMKAEDIEGILEAKRMQLRKNIGLQPVVIRHGFLDTTVGLCLTSREALRMARNKDAIDMAKRGEKERREAEKAEREAALYGKVKKMRLEQEKEALAYGVREYGVKSVLPKPMKERRMLAKRMAAEKKVHCSTIIARRISM